MGLVGLRDIDVVNGSADMWVIVAPEFHRRQFATTACRAFLRGAMAGMPWLRRVTVRHFSDNTGMARVADKLGFKLEGVLAKAVVRCGVARDVSTRAILRDDVMLSSVEEAEEDEGAE